MQSLTKKIFLKGNQCLTWGWYLRSSGIDLPLTLVNQFRIDEGNTIGTIARSLYPQGILVNEANNIKNHEKTIQLMSCKDTDVIFEATFINADLIARADILIRFKDGWHAIEVKSKTLQSISKIKEKEDLIEDMSYTALLISLCDIKLTKMTALLISKNYRSKMDNTHLFEEIEFTNEINNKVLLFRGAKEKISKKSGAKNRPKPKLIYICNNCEYYKNYCLGKNVKNPLFDLPNLREVKFNKLITEKAFAIEKIPTNFELTSLQKKVTTTVLNNAPILDKEKLKQRLSEIVFPVYYLDFESTSTALPLFNNIAPYEEIVTQYSIHKFLRHGKLERHTEYLSDHTKDDRRTLTLNLIRDIEKTGSVIVYHAAAEKRFINSLIKLFPDLMTDLENIVHRIIDLKEIIKESYYHPNFHGSFSIKNVLPVLVPAMSYDNLSIGEGESALVHFAKMARGKYTQEKVIEIRQNLLEYCKQDTLAMARIHETFVKLI